MRRSLGVVHIVFAPDPPAKAAQRAAALGFEHLDVPATVDESLVLPIGDRISPGRAQPGCSTPAPSLPVDETEADELWDKADPELQPQVREVRARLAQLRARVG